MRRRRFIALAGLSATVPLAGCSGEDDSDGSSDGPGGGTGTGSTDTDGDTQQPPPSSTNETIAVEVETATTGEGTNQQTEDDYSTGWTFPGSTGSYSVVSPGLQNTEYALRFDGFQQGYLSGAAANERVPRQGDRFEFAFEPIDYTGAPSIIRIQFACSGVDDESMYRIEFEGSNTSGSDWSLEKFTNGSQTMVDAADDGVGAAPGDEYRVEVDWNAGNNRITARWYNADGTQRSRQLSITDTAYTQPGICLMCNGNATVLWDEIRVRSS